MFLSGESIERAVTSGEIRIDPFKKENVKGASYTFTLGARILVPNKVEIVSVESKLPCEERMMASDGFVLAPGAFVIGFTQEKLTLNGKYVCILSARGSCAQIGLNVLLGSTLAEPDTDGLQTLEIHNVSQNSIRLQTGMRIVKGAFAKLQSLDV